ncbi:MAG: methionine--tRNA ligase [Candidatus Pacearchaeota archaeon]
MTKKFYITTAIDYVNAKPHIGHAFEKTLADAIARWHRLIGDKVWFLTGTDENAQKNSLAAKEAKIPVKEFVDKNSKIFIELCEKLNLSNDDFIRTTEKRHVDVSKEIIKKAFEKGDIYKKNYEGLYCYGCEAYKTEKDLIDGKCPEHPNRAISVLKEEAYFFKLSKYKNQIEKFVKDYIVPESRKNEILSRLKEDDLKDLCVTRKNSDWGIDFPLDKNFKVYVWFDALINYISGSGEKHEFWPADLHIVGKGINWFHSVIWPAILLSANYKLPKKLLVHGYLNLQGQKISKSLGNVIDPFVLVDKYGSDSVRYSLLRCSVFEDSDYSEEILIKRNNELADKLGNLVSRVSALIEKYGFEKNPKWDIPFSIIKLQKDVEKHFENYETDKALNEIFSFIDLLNGYVQSEKPWEIHEEDFKKAVLYNLALGIKTIAILLWSFIPSASEKIAKQFGFEIKYENIAKPLKENKIKKGEILFQKII